MSDYRIPEFEIIDQLASVRGSREGSATTTIRTETGRVIRAEVVRDYYQAQSWAVAQLLTDNGWVALLTEPAERWHHATGTVTRTETDVWELFDPIINELLTRAGMLLALPTE